METIICPCGKQFKIFPSRLKRSKYCSKKCLYKFRKRPSGLIYNIKTKNPTWFKKGQIAWNKGKPAKEYFKGWKGELARKDTKHKWIYRWFGKATICENCGSIKNVQWSNKSETYKRERSDWQMLCIKCHHKYDYINFKKRRSFYE